MAEFITNCPHCNSNLQVENEWIGMEAACPQCKTIFVITANNGENTTTVTADNDKNAAIPNNTEAKNDKPFTVNEMFWIIAIGLGIPLLLCWWIDWPRTIFWCTLPLWGFCMLCLAGGKRGKIAIAVLAGVICFGYWAHSRPDVQTTENSDTDSRNNYTASDSNSTPRKRSTASDSNSAPRKWSTVFGFNSAPKKQSTASGSNSAPKKQSTASGSSSVPKKQPPASYSKPSPGRISTAGRFASEISSVVSDFSYQNTMSKNIYQQICNGTYRTTELLNIIAKQHGCSTSSIMSDFSYQNTMSNNIYQQICNGTYRTTELLNLIAQKMGCSTSSIMSDFSYQNTMSNNIYQQICNGTYRTTELLSLIAKKFDE